MSVVHFNPDTNEFIETEGYTVKYYAACGVLTTQMNPKKRFEDKLDSTYDPLKVTCDNCKETEAWKEVNQLLSKNG